MATSRALVRPPASAGTAAPQPATPTATHRDRFIDALLAFAILAIVGQHWLLPAMSYESATLTTANSLDGPGAWAITWLGQVMPLIFFAGGAAAAISLRVRQRAADRPTSSWLASRTIRLAVPVLPLAAVWLLLPHLLIATGVPAQPVNLAAEMVGRPLWFLAVYVGLNSITPIMLQLHDRWRGREVIAMAATAIVVDSVRFAGSDGATWIGHANVVLVWGAVYQVGIAYASGRFDHIRRSTMLAVGVAGLAVSTVAVAVGPYAVSMIGTPGEPLSITNRPTTVLLALAAAQTSLALAFRNALTHWASLRPVGAMLDWLSIRMMTIYLWHTPALIVVTGPAVLVLGYATPELLGANWRADAPLWLAMLAFVLAGFVRAIGRCERRATQLISPLAPLARDRHRSGASLIPNSPVCRMGSSEPGRES